MIKAIVVTLVVLLSGLVFWRVNKKPELSEFTAAVMALPDATIPCQELKSKFDSLCPHKDCIFGDRDSLVRSLELLLTVPQPSQSEKDLLNQYLQIAEPNLDETMAVIALLGRRCQQFGEIKIWRAAFASQIWRNQRDLTAKMSHQLARKLNSDGLQMHMDISMRLAIARAAISSGFIQDLNESKAELEIIFADHRNALRKTKENKSQTFANSDESNPDMADNMSQGELAPKLEDQKQFYKENQRDVGLEIKMSSEIQQRLNIWVRKFVSPSEEHAF